MPELANPNLESSRILTPAGNIFILVCIVIIEALALRSFFKKKLKPYRSFSQLLIVSLLANIITFLARLPFVFNDFLAVNQETAFFSLPFLWVTSALLELPIYLAFFIKKYHFFNFMKASLLSNLYSTTLFILILQPFTYYSDIFSVSPPQQAELKTREAITQIIIKLQKSLECCFLNN